MKESLLHMTSFKIYVQLELSSEPSMEKANLSNSFNSSYNDVLDSFDVLVILLAQFVIQIYWFSCLLNLSPNEL